MMVDIGDESMAPRKPSKSTKAETPVELPITNDPVPEKKNAKAPEKTAAKSRTCARPRKPKATASEPVDSEICFVEQQVPTPAPDQTVEVKVSLHPTTDSTRLNASPVKSQDRKRPRRKKSQHLEVAVPGREELEADLEAEVEALADEEYERQEAMLALTQHAKTALEAIATGRALELIFLDSDNNAPRTFEARQLIFDAFSKTWFIWGWDRRYNAERHHRLDQFLEVNLVDGIGRAAQGPFPENTPANQIGGWRGGEVITVKALLMKQWIFAVKQAPAPFPDFHMEDTDEGKALLTFTGTDLRAIARWCMQFGDGIQVLEPLRLIDRMKQAAMAWGAKAQTTPLPTPSPVLSPAPAPSHAPGRETRHESRVEPRPEPKRPEPRPEPRPDLRPEPRYERPERYPEQKRQESPKEDTPKKSPRVEIRFERL